MQKVKTYYGMIQAEYDMNSHIKDGWRVHVCTMGTYFAGYTCHEKVLVVYEK